MANTSFACVFILSFALVAISIDGRKDPSGKYWTNVKNDQALLGTTNEVLDVAVVLPASVEDKADCDTMAQLERNFEHRKHMHFIKDFELSPNFSIHDKEGKIKAEENKSSSNDFEPRPNVSAYGDSDNHNGLNEHNNSVDDFEPRPNISIYHD